MDAFSLTVANLQDVFLFLAPGFIFILLFFYQVPGKSKDNLTIIFFSVLLSLVLDSFSTAILRLIDYQFHTHVRAVGTFWLALIISILLAIIAAKLVPQAGFRWISELLFQVNMGPFSRVWNNFFTVKEKTVLRVYLTDNTCYIGKLDQASLNPDDDEQEIVLVDPYYFEMVHNRPTITRVKETTSVLLRGNAIKSIEKIAEDEARKLYDLPK